MVLRHRRVVDWGLLLFCNLIWGSQFVVFKIVQRQVGPILASLLPIACATVFIFPFMFRRWDKRKWLNADRKVLKRDVLQFILIGVFGQVAAQLGIALGTRLTPASDAALLVLILPIATAFMAYLFLGERMTVSRWIGFALAVIGVIECSGIRWNNFTSNSATALLGNVILFGAINASAFYNAYSKKLLTRYSPIEVLFFSYCVVVVFMLPIAIFLEPQSFRNIPHFTASVWIGFLILSFFQYFLAMVVFLTVLTRLDATQAGLSNYLIPFFGVIIAAIVLHEHLTRYMIAGGIMVLVATVIVTFLDTAAGSHRRREWAKDG